MTRNRKVQFRRSKMQICTVLYAIQNLSLEAGITYNQLVFLIHVKVDVFNSSSNIVFSRSNMRHSCLEPVICIGLSCSSLTKTPLCSTKADVSPLNCETALAYSCCVVNSVQQQVTFCRSNHRLLLKSPV